MSNHVFDELPAFALGVLDPEEHSLVAEHLEECELCQKELAAYQVVADQLPLAVPERIPPSGLRDRILKQVSPQTKPQAAAKPSLANTLRGFFSAPVPAWSLLGAFVVAIALLALNLLGVGLGKPGNQDFRVVHLAGTDQAAVATGWIVISKDGNAGTLIVEGLPTLKENEQYQLWLVKDGQRKSGGVFSVDKIGYSSMWVYTKEPLIQYQQFGITVEPKGGSPGPTGAKVLGGKL